MTAFSEDEQFDNDLDWYAVDKEGNIGQFLTGGFRLLPPRVVSDKESAEILSNFFDTLPLHENGFIFCPDIKENFRDINQAGKDFMPFSQKMASRGLFSYDSNDYTFKQRPYIRITIPNRALKLTDLPKEIRDILESLKMDEISFSEDSVISEEYINKF